MKIKGWDLDFFNTGEWQVCDEKLKDLERTGRRIGVDGYNPGRKSLFEALRTTPAAEVRVAFIGQDPYPQKELATGLAFSIPGPKEDEGRSKQVQSAIEEVSFPPTLRTIFQEYESDLHYPIPSHGDLSRWGQQGVLLWNAIPTCRSGKSLSHDWPEWECLTREIVRLLAKRGVVFALLGQVARRFERDIGLSNNKVIVTSHPSPRGSISSKTPFLGSRLFSTINARLVENGQTAIDWKLP